MLYFVSRELALGYLLFCFLSALGILQYLGVRHRIVGFQLLTDSEHVRHSYGPVIVLIGGGALWFFVSQWEAIFAPGLAGAELCLLFGTGSVCALVLTLVLASLLQRPHRQAAPQTGSHEGVMVAVGSAIGHLHLPPNTTEPMPAVCMVAWPGADRYSMSALAQCMVQERMVVLTLSIRDDLASYPGILSLLPAAVALLSRRSEVDPSRLGALGHDLGGDLVIRSASSSKEIAAVAALAPVLLDPPIGFDLLREMPYLQALRWLRDRERARLRTELDALEHVAQIAPRPIVLMYGARDSLTTRPPDGRIDSESSLHTDVTPGAGHFDLVEHPVAMRTVVQWFREHL
ncbi:MAG TPA: acetylxylan esterase [Anaerolineae bacterium]|nr:acetylxylan esterase [Anaerolineae bacterium]